MVRRALRPSNARGEGAVGRRRTDQACHGVFIPSVSVYNDIPRSIPESLNHFSLASVKEWRNMIVYQGRIQDFGNGGGRVTVLNY